MGSSTSLLLKGGKIIYIQLKKYTTVWRTNSFTKLIINKSAAVWTSKGKARGYKGW